MTVLVSQVGTITGYPFERQPAKEFGPQHVGVQQSGAGGAWGEGRESTSYLIFHLTTTTLPDWSWLNEPTNGHSLTVGCLWAGPTAVLTNG